MENSCLSPQGLCICLSPSWEISSLAVPAGGVPGGSHLRCPQPQLLVTGMLTLLCHRPVISDLPILRGLLNGDPPHLILFPTVPGLEGGHALALEDRDSES